MRSIRATSAPDFQSSNLEQGALSWIRSPQNTSAPVLPASEWAAPFGNLIFGFAVTEALGIFSLLIALLLLFAL